MAEEVKDTNLTGDSAQTAADTSSTNTGFKPIESQEALDAIIQARLERKESSVRKEYEGYIKPDEYQGKLSELKEIRDKLTRYETDSAKKEIAAEFGLPEEMAKRLNGKDRKEWREDAQALSHYFKPSYPKKSSVNVDAEDEKEIKELLRKLRGK